MEEGMSKPYQFARTDQGAEFRGPPAAARRFVLFGTAWMAVLMGLMAALAAAALTVVAEANSPLVEFVTAVVGGLAGCASAVVTYRNLDRAKDTALLVGLDGRVSF